MTGTIEGFVGFEIFDTGMFLGRKTPGGGGGGTPLNFG